MTQEDQERYQRAMHAVQTGVAMETELPQVLDSGTSPKHLRVGVNAALVDSGALALLLLKKGVIESDEYERALADQAEAEVRRYEFRLSQVLRHEVKLA